MWDIDPIREKTIIDENGLVVAEFASAGDAKCAVNAIALLHELSERGDELGDRAVQILDGGDDE